MFYDECVPNVVYCIAYHTFLCIPRASTVVVRCSVADVDQCLSTCCFIYHALLLFSFSFFGVSSSVAYHMLLCDVNIPYICVKVEYMDA